MTQLVRMGTMMAPPTRGGGEAAPVQASITVVNDTSGTANLTFGPAVGGYARAGIEYIGAIDASTGRLYLVGFNADTGAFDSKTEVSSNAVFTTNKDIHHTPVLWEMADGVEAFILFAAHEHENNVRYRRTATGLPADLGSETTIDAGGATTYAVPPDQHPETGNPWFGTRVGTNAWKIIEKTGASSFTVQANPIVSHTGQMYVEWAKLEGSNEYMCLFGLNPNDGDGKIYSFWWRSDTGNCYNAAGTIIANYKTASPAASVTPALADVFYDPTEGGTVPIVAGTGAFFAGTNCRHRYFGQGYDDAFYDELHEQTCPDNLDPKDPANWNAPRRINLVGGKDYGYGAGSTTTQKFSYTSRGQQMPEVAAGKLRMIVGQKLLGKMLMSVIEYQPDDDEWLDVLQVNDVQETTSDSYQGSPWPFTCAGKAWAAITVCEHLKYDNRTGASLKVLRMDEIGDTAPTITSSASITVDEMQDLVHEITLDGAGGVSIVPNESDDSSKFEIWGGKYLFKRYATNLDAPDDVGGNGVFNFDLVATGPSGLSSDPVAHTVTINALTKTGGSQRFLQTANMNHASWTKSAVTVTNDSTDKNDADGGTTLDRIAQDGTSAAHQVTQAFTAPTSTVQTLHYEGTRDAEAPFIAVRCPFGSGNGAVLVIVDLRRYRIARSSGTVTPSAMFCRPLANNNANYGSTYTTPGVTSSGAVGICVRQNPGGDTNTEAGNVNAAGYARNPTYMDGKFKNHVVRTT